MNIFCDIPRDVSRRVKLRLFQQLAKNRSLSLSWGYLRFFIHNYSLLLLKLIENLNLKKKKETDFVINLIYFYLFK